MHSKQWIKLEQQSLQIQRMPSWYAFIQKMFFIMKILFWVCLYFLGSSNRPDFMLMVFPFETVNYTRITLTSNLKKVFTARCDQKVFFLMRYCSGSVHTFSGHLIDILAGIHSLIPKCVQRCSFWCPLVRSPWKLCIFIIS